MTFTRSRKLFGVLASLALLTAACGDDDDSSDTTDTTDDTMEESTDPTFEAGTTMAEIQDAGSITVGVKYDQPGFGLQNPTTNDVEGFDIEIAELIADAIGEDVEVEYVEAVSRNREPFIQDGTVDLVIATYTINDARKEVIDFAGPYFVAQQDIMVRADDDTITDVEDLNGQNVCTVTGSTSATNLAAAAPEANVTLLDTYSQCAEAMADGRVVAVTTDNTILAGLVQASDGAYKLIEAPFSDEPYGIGLPKGDDAFRDFLNDTLEELFDSGDWAEAFEGTLGAIGLSTPEPPTVDRYTATEGAPSTTNPAPDTTAAP